MGKVKITQTRSLISKTKKQKETIKSLGLRRINHSVVHELTPQIKGMIEKVSHIVKVEEV